MELREAIDSGTNQIKDAIAGCGTDIRTINIVLSEILNDDDDGVAFTLEVTLKPFQTDDGEVAPPPAIIELYHNRGTEEISMTVGEDSEWGITYGNVFAFLYFNNLKPCSA